ncbi:hypothetical protein CYMTET_7667 [Cymbomonas tetramitiformis]|uniref:Uncharacterized protein n=1 Tax=Cymbomonas tetramitiformis TaxID=36881 RepID=A0AAE0GUL6_9CHLO|nr:hypothetical protein CYMTET_48484 [Cymbomonas tetramitiformis]KAK3284695.1 hypothetical protein CYMTET_7667 [Cymbomonas tetramitiformis]
MTGEVEKTVVYERGSVQWVQMHVQEDTAREILGGLIPARVTAKCVSFKYPKSFTERDQLNHILGGTDGGPIWYKKVHDQSTTELCETDFKQTFWLKYVRLPVGVLKVRFETRRTGNANGISDEPLLDTRGDQREVTIMDMAPVPQALRTLCFGSTDTLYDLRNVVIACGSAPQWIKDRLARHQRAEWAQYFRFPDVSAWEERSIAADDYLEPRGYQIQLLFCPTIAEDEVRLGARAAEDG